METKDAYELIKLERDYQDGKWGKNSHTNEEWSIIANEEAGEVANAILKTWMRGDTKLTREELMTELVQQAAVLVAWIENRLEDMPEAEYKLLVYMLTSKGMQVTRQLVKPD